MSIASIKAEIQCDGCGCYFSVALDPARKLPEGWSLFDEAVDTVRGGCLAHSVEADLMLCSDCTKAVARDERFAERDPTADEIRDLLRF